MKMGFSRVDSVGHHHTGLVSASLLSWLCCCAVAFGEVKVSSLFSDQMVLQRDRPVAVFGTGNNDEEITVQMNGQRKKVKVANGKWKVMLDASPAGGSHTLKISAKGFEKSFKEVTFGDVWVCSGQSNMAGTVRHYAHSKYAPTGGKVYAEMMKSPARYKNIRVLGFAKTPTAEVLSEPLIHSAYSGSWQKPNAKSLMDTSAIGFAFAVDIEDQLDVPIGLITAARGATSITTWMSDETLASCKVRGPATSFYRSMIAPLTEFTIKGVIWYQGENNSRSFASCKMYERCFKGMIRDWREEWSQGDFPFLFFALSGFQAKPKYNATIHWPYMRESQAKALELANTGMVSITDLGHPSDIHPHYKLDQAKRLVPLALKVAYGKDVIGSGPRYSKVEFSGGKALVTFTDEGGGLVAEKIDRLWLKVPSGKLQGFVVAGSDKKFYPATAVIKGNKVEVSSPQVDRPTAVRYGWGGMPKANLFNKDGFPAAQFRTDDFEPGSEAWHTPPE